MDMHAKFLKPSILASKLFSPSKSSRSCQRCSSLLPQSKSEIGKAKFLSGFDLASGHSFVENSRQLAVHYIRYRN